MTSYLTIDAGVAFKLIAPHPKQATYIDQFSRWQQAGYQLCAPTLWAYEITSTFTKMVHFGEMSAENGYQGIQLAYRLGVQLFAPDADQALNAFAWTTRLQRAAAYDSFYLALAEQLDCDLWTADKRLVNAVNQPWVKLI